MAWSTLQGSRPLQFYCIRIASRPIKRDPLEQSTDFVDFSTGREARRRQASSLPMRAKARRDLSDSLAAL
jgi:hypothetical protein